MLLKPDQKVEYVDADEHSVAQWGAKKVWIPVGA